MELTVKDLKPGDRVIMDRGIGVVQKGEKGVVTGKTEWQVFVKFPNKELKLGDNGTRYLRKAVLKVSMREMISGMGTGGTSVCVCPGCGYEENHVRGIPCNTKLCACGTALTGKDTVGSKLNIKAGDLERLTRKVKERMEAWKNHKPETYKTLKAWFNQAVTRASFQGLPDIDIHLGLNAFEYKTLKQYVVTVRRALASKDIKASGTVRLKDGNSALYVQKGGVFEVEIVQGWGGKTLKKFKMPIIQFNKWVHENSEHPGGNPSASKDIKAGLKILFYDSSKNYRGRKKFVSHRDNYLEIKSWVESGNFIKLPMGLSKDLNSIINYFEKGNGINS